MNFRLNEDGYVRIEKNGVVYCEPVADFEQDSGVILPALLPEGMTSVERREDGVVVFYDAKHNAFPRETPPEGVPHEDIDTFVISLNHTQLVTAAASRKEKALAEIKKAVLDKAEAEAAEATQAAAVLPILGRADDADEL